MMPVKIINPSIDAEMLLLLSTPTEATQESLHDRFIDIHPRPQTQQVRNRRESTDRSMRHLAGAQPRHRQEIHPPTNSTSRRAAAPKRSLTFPFLAGLLGVVCGTLLLNVIGLFGGGMRPFAPHSLTLAEQQCPEWAMTAAVQRQAQHDYCVRRFTGRPPRTDIAKARLTLPGNTTQDFFVYTRSDIVSGRIRGTGAWEPHMSTGLVDALSRVVEARGLPRERVHLLDIGANLGSHTVYAQAAGFSVVAFEPMLLNEDIIRSNLCVADPKQERVTFFTKGLGTEDGVCTFYSHQTINQGDGVLKCDGTRVNNDYYVDQGQVEVRRLDDILLPCRGGRRLPPGIVFGAMKMDVEGFEPLVLQGARRFLAQARIPFIAFEIGRLEEAKRRSVLRFFYDLGYRASSEGFVGEMGQPEDFGGVEDVFLALPL